MPIQDQYQSTAAVAETQSCEAVSSPSAADIQGWLKAYLATSLDLSPEEIDIDTDFVDFGMNSMSMIDVSGELETLLGRRLDPTLVLDYSNIRALSEYLVDDSDGSSLPRPSLPSDVDQLLSKLDVMSDDEVDGLLSSMLSEHDVAHE